MIKTHSVCERGTLRGSKRIWNIHTNLWNPHWKWPVCLYSLVWPQWALLSEWRGGEASSFSLQRSSVNIFTRIWHRNMFRASLVSFQARRQSAILAQWVTGQFWKAQVDLGFLTSPSWGWFSSRVNGDIMVILSLGDCEDYADLEDTGPGFGPK